MDVSTLPPIEYNIQPLPKVDRPRPIKSVAIARYERLCEKRTDNPNLTLADNPLYHFTVEDLMNPIWILDGCDHYLPTQEEFREALEVLEPEDRRTSSFFDVEFRNSYQPIHQRDVILYTNMAPMTNGEKVASVTIPGDSVLKVRFLYFEQDWNPVRFEILS